MAQVSARKTPGIVESIAGPESFITVIAGGQVIGFAREAANGASEDPPFAGPARRHN